MRIKALKALWGICQGSQCKELIIDIFLIKKSTPMIDIPLLVIYLRAIGTVICHTEIELNSLFPLVLHKIPYMVFKLRY